MTQFIQQAINGLLLGGMFALMALGLTLMFGVMKIVNFAYGTLYMVGGYIAYFFAHDAGLSFFGALACGFVVMMAVGLALEMGFFRPLRDSEERTILMGLGLLLLGRGLIIEIFGSQTHSLDIPLDGRIVIGNIVVSQQRVLTFALAVIFVVGVWFVLSRTRVGAVTRAVSDDPIRAALLGISRSRVIAVSFAVATGLAAIAAGLLSSSFGVVPTVDDTALITSFSIVVLGGLGSVPGALIGGLAIGLLNTLGTQYISQTYAPMYPFVLLLAVLLIRPQGLFGQRERVA